MLMISGKPVRLFATTRVDGSVGVAVPVIVASGEPCAVMRADGSAGVAVPVTAPKGAVSSPLAVTLAAARLAALEADI